MEILSYNEMIAKCVRRDIQWCVRNKIKFLQNITTIDHAKNAVRIKYTARKNRHYNRDLASSPGNANKTFLAQYLINKCSGKKYC